MTNEIKIDRDVPLPGRTGSDSMYPWGKLSVGESFFVSNPPAFFLSMISPAAKKHGIKLCSRKEGSGRRVWRVA